VPLRFSSTENWSSNAPAACRRERRVSATAVDPAHRLNVGLGVAVTIGRTAELGASRSSARVVRRPRIRDGQSERRRSSRPAPAHRWSATVQSPGYAAHPFFFAIRRTRSRPAFEARPPTSNAGGFGQVPPQFERQHVRAGRFGALTAHWRGWGQHVEPITALFMRSWVRSGASHHLTRAIRVTRSAQLFASPQSQFNTPV
jgi:hypothetical protein